MSTPTSPSGSLSTFPSTAEIRVLFPGRMPWSNYELAYIALSSRIYWKLANKDGSNKPQSLWDFRNGSSLELTRLKDDDSWDTVNEIVKVDSYEGRTRIKIRGRLHGRKRRNHLYLVSGVELEIILSSPEQHEVWVNNLRARIAPWTLLQREMKNASGVEALEVALGGLGASTVGSKSSSTSADKVEEKWRDNLGTLPDQMQKISIVDKLTAHGAAAVGTGATLAKFVASAERVTETAELLANVSKCVAGVCTIFQLISLSAQGVSMCAEASRGRRALPVVLGQITILLRYELESLAEINKPSRSVTETDMDFVLDTLKETVCVMDGAETQLLRDGVSQIMNAEDVKELERKLEELIHRVVTTGAISRICALDERMKQLEQSGENVSDGPHHVRPSVSAFFSGRKEELKTLKDKLERWGSAAITQFGGAGKTELVIAFADRAVRDGQVPGGVFWVTADGDVRDVIGSLAGLAEKLTRRKMNEDERRNANVVIARLEQGLNEKEGRWLLCLDNADNEKVGGVLNEVCRLAERSRGSGWVVITSRQGRPRVWAEMEKDQKMILEPFCVEDAMVALWRQSRGVKTDKADDDQVMKEIKKLEGVDETEYCALKKLCGDDDGGGLGGLPLALVQAGSFIAQMECSFSEYVELFESANRNEDWEYVMNETEEVKPIEDSQRSIWTTWKISVEKLSVTARTVLRGMAMLGQGGIRERMVKGILEAITGTGGGIVTGMFENVIKKELMHGSSLIRHYEGEERGKRKYGMHRLVRRFVQKDMGRGSGEWKDVYSFALGVVHERVKTELEKEGKSFSDLPDIFEANHGELSIHSVALVHHFVIEAEGSEGSEISGVVDIHWYSGYVMEFMGKFEEAALVWEQLVAILRQESEKIGRGVHGNKPHPDIASSLGNLGNVYGRMGELEKALEKHEESLEIFRAVHGNKPHPDIASSLNNIGNVYQRMGELEKALEKHEESLEMYTALHGNKPHPDIASSLNNIGNVYERMGELEKALEKHEESLEMKRAVHGNKPHPDIASSLNNLGNVYEGMGELEKALEKHEESLEMYRAVHGNKPHPHIASSLWNLGNVYARMGELEKALEKHEESLEMKRAVHRNKPHPDTAISLWSNGLIHRSHKNMSRAAEFLEQSLEMLRTVHGRNSQHSSITGVLSNLAEVYGAQGERDEVGATVERSREINETSDGEVLKRTTGN